MLLIKGLIFFGALVIHVTGLFKFDPMSKRNCVLTCCNLCAVGWAGVSECELVARRFSFNRQLCLLLRAVAMATLLALVSSLRGVWSGGCYASIVRSVFFCVCVTIFVNSGTRRFSKCDEPHKGKPLAPSAVWAFTFSAGCNVVVLAHVAPAPLYDGTSTSAKPSAYSDTQNQCPIWCHQRPHSRIPCDIWTYTHQTQTFNPNPHRALVSRNRPLLCSEILTSRPSFPSDTGSDLYQSDI